MAEETENKQCQHIGCTCDVPAGEMYCSPQCESSPHSPACTCGHAGCGTEPRAATFY